MRTELEASPEVEVQILRTLNEIAKHKNDAEASIAPLERLVEINPDDREARFALGFAHSQTSNDGLALLHYSKIPEHERDGATWNNIGVSSDQTGLVAQSVEAYREAESKQETLAMSNLAVKYLKAGFLPEATAKCDEALKLEEPNRNIGRAWSDAKALPDKERERLKKILAAAAPVSDFYRQFGHAMTLRRPDRAVEIWTAPEGAVSVKIEGNEFTAEGTYEVDNTLGLLLAGSHAFGVPPPLQKYRVSYRGTLEGRAVRGAVQRVPQDGTSKTPSLLAFGNDQPEILMFFTTDLTELKVLERSKSATPRFYSLLQKNPASVLPASKNTKSLTPPEAKAPE
jgi:hypothetical protein